MDQIQTISLWLLTPLSGSNLHDIAPLVAWHARLMVLAWSVLIPLGVLIARFYKVTPKQDFPRVTDSKFWWHGHRALQYTGVLLSVLAAYLIAKFQLTSWHAICGYILLALGLLQIMGALLRGSKGGPTDTQMRGDHFDMTRHRRIFEWLHKRMGYGALALTMLTTLLGLVLADAPRWMPIIITLWWLTLIFAFTLLQRRGRNVDTYTAIWGKPFSG
jgi:hypothetical protein